MLHTHRPKCSGSRGKELQFQLLDVSKSFSQASLQDRDVTDGVSLSYREAHENFHGRLCRDARKIATLIQIPWGRASPVECELELALCSLSLSRSFSSFSHSLSLSLACSLTLSLSLSRSAYLSHRSKACLSWRSAVSASLSLSPSLSLSFSLSLSPVEFVLELQLDILELALCRLVVRT